MIEKLKNLPWSVKAAAVFLLAVYVAMCFMAPMIGLGLGVGVGTILSIIRVAHYLHFGD